MLQFGQKANEAQLGNLFQKLVVDADNHATATYTVPDNKRILVFEINPTAGNFTATFPHASKFPNSFYTVVASIKGRAAAASFIMAIPGNHAVGQTTVDTVTRAGGTNTAQYTKYKFILFSDGYNWHVSESAAATV